VVPEHKHGSGVLATVGRRVLIVDDEPDLVETCVRLLARRKYSCLRAHSGQEGITLIEREQPLVVLADLYLPDIDGFSVIRHARGQSPPIPGILMTAYTSAQVIDRAHEAGAMLYLPKPFSDVDLIEAVGRAIR